MLNTVISLKLYFLLFVLKLSKISWQYDSSNGNRIKFQTLFGKKLLSFEKLEKKAKLQKCIFCKSRPIESVDHENPDLEMIKFIFCLFDDASRSVNISHHFWPLSYEQFWIEIQASLVIRGVFICEFAHSHCQKWWKLQFSCQKWPFYLQIQNLRSKMTERIYRE